MSFNNGLVAVKCALRAISLNIPFKPVAKVLCQCKASRQCVDTFIKASRNIEQALDISDKEIAEALDGLPPSRMHCAELGHELIKSAVDDFIQRKGD